jgi:hypothetical protein
MTRWLVTQIPAGVLLVVLIVLVAGGAIVLQTVIRRRFPTLTGDEHNDVTKFTYGFIGFVYAFFVGFMVSAMWGHINTADGNARAEGAAAVEMATDATAFNKSDSDRIRQSLLAYEQAAITEWTKSEDGRSPAADAALADLRAAYSRVQATDDTQKAALATSRTNLDKISQARTVRILTAEEDAGPPWPLWAVILLTSAMVLGTAVIYGVERAELHYPMVAVVGVVVATNLFLLIQLAHPFLGDIATSPGPLEAVTAVLSGQR